jgi:hypothetical protein
MPSLASRSGNGRTWSKLTSQQDSPQPEDDCLVGLSQIQNTAAFRHLDALRPGR